MMSRFDTRTCREGGWDNQLPVCEGTEKSPTHLKIKDLKVGFSPKNHLSKEQFLKKFLV